MLFYTVHGAFVMHTAWMCGCCVRGPVRSEHISAVCMEACRLKQRGRVRARTHTNKHKHTHALGFMWKSPIRWNVSNSDLGTKLQFGNICITKSFVLHRERRCSSFFPLCMWSETVCLLQERHSISEDSSANYIIIDCGQCAFKHCWRRPEMRDTVIQIKIGSLHSFFMLPLFYLIGELIEWQRKTCSKQSLDNMEPCMHLPDSYGNSFLRRFGVTWSLTLCHPSSLFTHFLITKLSLLHCKTKGQ